MIIVDAHADTISRAFQSRGSIRNFPQAQLDLNRLEKSGVKLQFFAVFVRPQQGVILSIDHYLEQIAFFRQQLAENRSRIRLIRKSEDLADLSTSESIGALLSIEGGECLEGRISNLHRLYDLGVRSLCLTWNYRNALASGVYEPGAGLTAFGRQVVEEMNRLGMLIDIAHLAEDGYWDVLSCSARPVVVSHANCRHLHDHPRNLSDRQMQALAQQGGVMGITLVNEFLGGRPGIERVIDHFVHACQVMGPLHVGLGTDFDGVDTPVQGLEDVSCLPRLVEGLLRRGFNDQQVEHIMGQNFLRVLYQTL